MAKGKVKWFDVRKGYGYITDENGNDQFVHFSSIQDGRIYVGLREGDEVEFDSTVSKKGNQASNVKLITPHKNVTIVHEEQ